MPCAIIMQPLVCVVGLCIMIMLPASSSARPHQHGDRFQSGRFRWMSRQGLPSQETGPLGANKTVSRGRSAVPRGRSAVPEPYDPGLAKFLVVMSRVSYDHNAEYIGTPYCSRCHGYAQYLSNFQLSGVLRNDTLDTLAVVGIATDRSAIVVAFRGSATGRNWFFNALFGMSPVWPEMPCPPDAAVHHGFKAGYESLRKSLFLQVAKLTASHPGVRRILVTGHSLGGALATMAALDFSVRYPAFSVFMYTFGAPAVGNEAFADCFARTVQTSYRLVNPNDVIALVLLPNFKHVPQVISAPDSPALTNLFEGHVNYLGVHSGR